MYSIKAGEAEKEGSPPLEQKRQLKDFERAKSLAIKLLKDFEQVEIIDVETAECVYFQVSKISQKRMLLKKKSKGSK